MIVEVETYCPLCHTAHIIKVEESDYLDWCDGKATIEAFPYLNADDREMLITGVCPKCWAEMSYDDDYEDENEDYEPSNLDMGFDPYMGCYSDDC